MIKSNGAKLLNGEEVEVRSLEDGFLGSWHSAVVVTCTKQCRIVRYNHIVDQSSSENLIVSISVSEVIDGSISPSTEISGYHRSVIRPVPQSCDSGTWNLHYGLCVDAFYMDAWWEGVILDHEDGSKKRKVFFPDLGDELDIEVGMLRITLDWDADTDRWIRRGCWLLLEIVEEIEREWPVFVSIKQIWYDVRSKQKFDEVGEWTFSLKYVWKELILEVVSDNFKITLTEFYNQMNLLMDSGMQSLTGMLSEISSKHEANITNYTPRKHAGGFHSFDSELETTASQPHGNSGTTDAFIRTTDLKLESPELISDGLKDGDNRGITNHSKVSILRNSDVCDRNGDCLKTPPLPVAHSNSEVLQNWDSVTSKDGFTSVYLPLSKPKGSNHIRKKRQGNYSSGNKAKVNKKSHAHDHVKLQGIEFTSHSVTESTSSMKSVEMLSKGQSVKPRKQISHKLYVRQEQKDIVNKCTFYDYENRHQSPNVQNSDHFSPKNFPSTSEIIEASPGHNYVFIEPGYFPQSIVDWYLSSTNSGYNVEFKNMCFDNARRHLIFLGWRISSSYDYAKKLRYNYITPSGKHYYSLRLACKCVIDKENMLGNHPSISEPGNNNLNPGTQVNDELRMLSSQSKNPSVADTNASFSLSKRKLCAESRAFHHRNNLSFYVKRCDVVTKSTNKMNKMKFKRCSYPKFNRKSLYDAITRGVIPKRILRSTKLPVPKSYRHKAKTVLAWLIDNNSVLPREKVQYRKRTDCHSMAEGRITRDGIKCNCCQKTFTIAAFGRHAGGTNHRPTEYIFVEDGRSLLECQMEVVVKNNRITDSSYTAIQKNQRQPYHNDCICTVCHYGGDLILCDHCPSAFHKGCLGLKDVPKGDWFCRSCLCVICGLSRSKDNLDKDGGNSFVKCYQCHHHYHVLCLNPKSVKTETVLNGDWFCSSTCKKIFVGLEKLIGKSVTVDCNLTWTLFRSKKYDALTVNGNEVGDFTENYSKLNVATDVMHECFEPVRDPQTSRDLVGDVIFCRRSKLNRLNFQGFYTVLLERDDELISVACVRVHGKRIAEVPLIGTRFQYRRLGMCRVLMNHLEEVLNKLGVEQLVLPAVQSLLNTWTVSFGFSKMREDERHGLLEYTFLDFQDTVMCNKMLSKQPTKGKATFVDRGEEKNDKTINTPISEVFQTK